MKKLDVPYQRMKPGRYASELRKLVRTHEPKRKLDLMIVHALIEARSCERFRLLAKRLPEQVRDLYEQLERSEARHFELYLNFAEREFEAEEIAERLELIADARSRARDQRRPRTALPLRYSSGLTHAEMGPGPIIAGKWGLTPFQRGSGISRTPSALTPTQLAASYHGASTTRSAFTPSTTNGARPGDACGRESVAARRWRAWRASRPRDSRP